MRVTDPSANILKLLLNFYLLLLTAGLLCSLTGCGALIPASEHRQNSAGDIRIDVPFLTPIETSQAPSCLAMVASYYGHAIQPEAVAALGHTPDRQDRRSIEMPMEIRDAAQNLGFVAYIMKMGIESLRAEIDAERPVIVLQHSASDDSPGWRYAVVAGRSPDNQYLLLHSGRHKYYRHPRQTFADTWQRANNRALIITPVGDIPASASQAVVIKAASALEKAGKLRAAQITYASAAERWPNSFAAYIGLAGTHMRLHEPLAASQAYEQALQLDTRSVQALNSFVYSAFESGCQATALMAASCAIRTGKSNPLAIAATLAALKDRTTRPSNHPDCPKINCNPQAPAAD